MQSVEEPLFCPTKLRSHSVPDKFILDENSFKSSSFILLEQWVPSPYSHNKKLIYPGKFFLRGSSLGGMHWFITLRNWSCHLFQHTSTSLCQSRLYSPIDISQQFTSFLEVTTSITPNKSSRCFCLLNWVGSLWTIEKPKGSELDKGDILQHEIRFRGWDKKLGLWLKVSQDD